MATAVAKKKPMTKAQLIAQLAETADVPKTTVAQILDELAKTAYKQAKLGFTLPGIGKLQVVKRKARMGRNPRTGETMKIPARTALKFRIAKACKDEVLQA